MRDILKNILQQKAALAQSRAALETLIENHIKDHGTVSFIPSGEWDGDPRDVAFEESIKAYCVRERADMPEIAAIRELSWDADAGCAMCAVVFANPDYTTEQRLMPLGEAVVETEALVEFIERYGAAKG